MTDLTQPKFFGRRKGRTIHKTKAHLLEAFLPQVSLDTSLSLSKETLFPKPVSKIFLEIGFGDGAHLAAQALKNQDIGYIGVEVFKNGVAHLLSLITNTAKGDVSTMPTLAPERCDNIRIFADDVRLLFPKIPNSFIDRVYLLFPDPWPKKRHAERRFVNPENLKELARILRQIIRFIKLGCCGKCATVLILFGRLKLRQIGAIRLPIGLKQNISAKRLPKGAHLSFLNTVAFNIPDKL